MLKILCLLGIIAISFVSCSTTNIYIVRHGERANDTDTTSLSAAGHERAKALATRLANTPIDSIFVTPYTRTAQTAAVVAAQLHLPLTKYPAAPVATIANRLATLQGKNALVVGHSNTVLEIARALGTTPSMTKIDHLDYDNLLFIQFKRTPFGRRVHLYEEVYGKPTP